MRRFIACAALVFALVSGRASLAQEPPLPQGLAPRAEEPALPQGLGGGSEPALPPGLGGASEPSLPSGLAPSSEPGLPEGLGRDAASAATGEAPRRGPALPFDLHGFLEGRLGTRVRRDPYERQLSIGETRLQLDLRRIATWARFSLKGDFLYDPVLERHSVDLERGEGWFDLREANVAFSPAPFADIKVGRQVLTWGTGDLLFINDLFPKDWNSFFIGRDAEYLKAPSDAVKASFFTPLASLDLVYVPRFDSDRYIDGRRLSYYNAALGRHAGRDAVVRVDRPDDWFTDDEFHARLSRYLGRTELALYGYYGFWKSPAGSDPATGRATFPPLAVYGASARRAVGKGIGNVEFGYYDSRDDRSGRDPFVRNSEARGLVGYEQEIARDFTAGVQYYAEYMLHHNRYRASLPPNSRTTDEYRHVLTLRLTRLMLAQNLRLSLFTYYSPSDQDAYLRPNAHYKISDHWSVETGANLFLGERAHTFFGQFTRNSNVYIGARYSF